MYLPNQGTTLDTKKVRVYFIKFLYAKALCKHLCRKKEKEIEKFDFFFFLLRVVLSFQLCKTL